MPRLPPFLVQKAARQSHHLPFLLKECRDLRSAQNELRWLREHVQQSRLDNSTRRTTRHSSIPGWRTELDSLVARRSRGEPLQYILGSQPFGDLDLICTKGVLIPREDTARWVESVADLIREDYGALGARTRNLKILDLCTGSGCISLLLWQLLGSTIRRFQDTEVDGESQQLPRDDGKLHVLGLDVSRDAIKLARRNLEHNVNRGLLHSDSVQSVRFELADVMSWSGSAQWDVIVSNPPYVSEKDYSPGGPTSRSVRLFEPKLALVPDSDTLSFYHRIMDISIGANAKLIAMEVGGSAQAQEVVGLAKRHMAKHKPCSIVVIRDDGSIVPGGDFNNESVGDAAEGRAVVIVQGSLSRS